MDKFTTAYIICGLWLSADDYDKPIDSNYSIEDIHPDSLKKIIQDCQKFQEENALYLEDYPLENAGHDFWLTRNRHGSGFWENDFGNEESNIELTKSSHNFGECYLYVGDDGKIHI